VIGRLQTAVEFAGEEASPWGALKLIAGSANPDLAAKISDQLNVPLTDPRLRRFPDGEINVKIEDSMRGHDVFVIQPTSPPVNEHLMELFIILDALRRASAGRVTAVIPYYGYARKERKTQPREPISAKLVANFITLAGADRLLLLDLHAEAIEGFFDVPTDHLSPHRIFADHLRTLGLRHITVVAPDAGGGRRAEAVANQLEAPIAFGYKRRRCRSAEQHAGPNQCTGLAPMHFFQFLYAQAASDRGQIQGLPACHAGGTAGMRKQLNHAHAHLGRCRNRGVGGENLESQHLQSVADQNSGGLIEGFVAGGPPAAQIIIVHRGQIVVHQRVGMNQFHRGSGAIQLGQRNSQSFSGGVNQNGP